MSEDRRIKRANFKIEPHRLDCLNRLGLFSRLIVSFLLTLCTPSDRFVSDCLGVAQMWSRIDVAPQVEPIQLAISARRMARQELPIWLVNWKRRDRERRPSAVNMLRSLDPSEGRRRVNNSPQRDAVTSWLVGQTPKQVGCGGVRA